MDDRLSRFLNKMAAADLSAALITKPENIRYLSAYTGEGALLASAQGAVIITDFRYVEQAEQEAPGLLIEQTTGEVKLDAILARLVKDGGHKKLAVETDRISYDHYLKLESALNGVVFEPLGAMAEELRAVKDESEIRAIAEASAVSCAAFEDILLRIRPGMTEREISRELEYAMLKRGAEAIGFQTIACAGPNGSLPHATPTDRPVQRGELLTLDFGAQVRGYKSDITRTVAIGKIDGELMDVYETVQKAQRLALSMIKAGAPCAQVDLAAREFIDARYPGAFGHGLGHGVGLEIHEAPGLSRTGETTLCAGHVVTVEPGIYLKGIGGCRIEDTVVVTEGGYTNLMSAEKELIIL